MLRADRLSKMYGRRAVLDRVSFAVEAGDFFGVLGPNGSGKSTLLRLLSGAERPDEGSVTLRGRPLAGYSRKQLSRLLAVLQQEAVPPVGFTVREVVEMGRYPYQNWLGEEKSEEGREVVERLLEQLELTGLARRPLQELSGGERQRVALGQVMAQQPTLLLLDEPTTYLDIGHQVQLMDRIRAWQREKGMTVVAVLHDLNLAAMYCNRMLLLHRGEIAALGPPAELLRGGLIRRVYGTEPIVVEHPEHRIPQLLLRQGGTDNGPTVAGNDCAHPPA